MEGISRLRLSLCKSRPVFNTDVRAIFIADGHLDLFWHSPVSTLSRVLYCIFSQVITSSHLGRHPLAKSHGSALHFSLSPHPASFSMCDLVSCPFSCVSLPVWFCLLPVFWQGIIHMEPWLQLQCICLYFTAPLSLLTTPSSCHWPVPHAGGCSPATAALDCIYSHVQWDNCE